MFARYQVLIIAIGSFVFFHLFLSALPIRRIIVGKLGEQNFFNIYSAIALVLLVWSCMVYSRVPHYDYLWVPNWWAHYVPLVTMPFAFILVISGLTLNNPSSVGNTDRYEEHETVQGILFITRHPIQWGIFIWAVSHIIANGDIASTIFFGGFATLSFVGTFLMDIKKRVQWERDWDLYDRYTSNIPFWAILSGKNKIRLNFIRVWPIVTAIGFYLLMLLLHWNLFDVEAF